MHWIRPPYALLLLTLLSLAAASPARAADFYANVASGVDDLMLADGSAGRPWKTLSFTLGQIPVDESHVIHLAAGVYSEAEGETLPYRLPVNVALEGSPGGGTVLVDTRAFGAPTIFWQVRTPDTLDSTNFLRRLQIRRQIGAVKAGRGIAIEVRDTVASPTLEALIITGAETGIDLFADSDLAPTSLAPLISNCIVTDNQIGLLASAYTFAGEDSEADPILTNNVFSSNIDGIVFETGATYELPTGARRNATSSAILRHCTFAKNIGSGIVLDDTNLGLAAAGPCRPSIVNCIFSAADGDYGIDEFSTTSFPSLLENNMFEASPLGFYRKDGLTDLLTITEVNALGSSDANFEGSPAFMRDTTADWRLRADSPGVDSAQASTVNLDFEGDRRPSDTDGDGTATSEVGFDEAPHCAVSAVIEPDLPEDRCGVFGPLDFDASLSAITAGFPNCSVPLRFSWFLDGIAIPGETTPFLSVTPDRTGLYQVRVSCADDPSCSDAASAPVQVFDLPRASAGGSWSTCIANGADSVTIELLGEATPPDGAVIEAWSWSTDNPMAAFLGGATPTPILELTGYTDFANLSFDVTLTVTDSNGCSVTDTAVVNVFRGPQPSAGGPYVACQDVGPQSYIPLMGGAVTPVGSTVVAWSWSSSVGSFDDETSQTPSLIRNNLDFTVTSLVTVTATDDKGCTATSEEVLVTLHPSPTANAGGPYQLQEDMSGTTSFALDGSASGGGIGAISWSWATDLGSFVPPSADTEMIQLDIVNTGVDQTANVCLTVTDQNACPHTDCTEVSVKAGPLVPPNDVGGTLHIAKVAGEAFFAWSNSPLDATHDLADRYEVWDTQNVLPDPGGWTIRQAGIPPRGGVSIWQETALLGVAGPDMIFLKVVARNDAGASCVMQVMPRPTLDPDCAP